MLNGRFVSKRKLHLYCNTDWFGKTTKVYDKAGNVQKKTDAYGAQVEKNVHYLSDFDGYDASNVKIPIDLSRNTSGRNDGCM